MIFYIYKYMNLINDKKYIDKDKNLKYPLR